MHFIMREVNCGVLVYSINDLQSFNELDDWHNDFINYSDNCLLVLVGTKSDLNESRKISQ